MSDWAGQFGSCVFFRPTDPPRSVLGSGWSLSFVCLLVFFVFSFVFVFPHPAEPPHSVLGHGLGNLATKLRHGNVGFSYSLLFSVLPTPSSAPSREAARVIWLLLPWNRTVCFCLIFFVIHAILFSLSHTFSTRRVPSSRDCGLCHLSISCWFSPFRLDPPPR